LVACPCSVEFLYFVVCPYFVACPCFVACPYWIEKYWIETLIGSVTESDWTPTAKSHRLESRRLHLESRRHRHRGRLERLVRWERQGRQPKRQLR
jgi:hypothetical protein